MDGERHGPLDELQSGELVRVTVTSHQPWGLIAEIHGFEPVGASLDVIRRGREPGVRQFAQSLPAVGSTLELVIGSVRAWVHSPRVLVDLTTDAPVGGPLIVEEAANLDLDRVMGSYFQRVQWVHDTPDDYPVVLWAHVVDGWEARKVDEFHDGRLAWADDTHETETTGLGKVPVPLPEVIGADPQFVVEIIERSDFERVWLLARGENSAASPRRS